MNDNDPARTGYTKLYHPRGPLVSLPVVGETPAAMFAWVTAILDAGFVVAAPGLDVGEEHEMASAVLHSTFEREGEITDTILLYAANEGLEYSFLKIYLNNDEDVKGFEACCGVRLDNIPTYDGKDKPKRDGGTVARKYIVKFPRPVSVVFKQNPKWSEEESAKAIAAQKPYTTPKRVFVRWADAPASGQPAATAPSTPAATPPSPPQGPSERDIAAEAWRVRLANVIGVDDMNRLTPMVKAITDEGIRKLAWTMCMDAADARKWVFDKDAKMFRHAAELALTPATTPPPPSAPPPPPDMVDFPPPPDEAPDPPLIVSWKKKLDPETVNLSKMNGELMTAFKSIGKNEPLRGQVWRMFIEFGQKHGCNIDSQTMKFVERMP